MIKSLCLFSVVCLTILVKTYADKHILIKRENKFNKKPIGDTNVKINASPVVVFNHHTYNDFIKGKFSDAGGNLYVSKKGNLQFINLFDLNADGYPEVVTNNDHNGYDTPDALVYHNTQPNGLRSLNFAFAQDAPAFQNFNLP